MAEALGWSGEAFDEAFGELLREGMVKADWQARLVFVPKAVVHNPPESPNVIRSWRDTMRELGDSPLKRFVLQELQAFVQGMGEGFPKAFAQAFGEDFAQGCANQEQEQEQEQHSPQSPLTGGHVVENAFKFTGAEEAPPRNAPLDGGLGGGNQGAWEWPPKDPAGKYDFSDCPRPHSASEFRGSDLHRVLDWLFRKVKVPAGRPPWPSIPDPLGRMAEYDKASLWLQLEATGRKEHPAQLAIHAVMSFLSSSYAIDCEEKSGKRPALITWLNNYDREAPWREGEGGEAA